MNCQNCKFFSTFQIGGNRDENQGWCLQPKLNNLATGAVETGSVSTERARMVVNVDFGCINFAQDVLLKATDM